MTLAAAGVRIEKVGEFNPFIETNRMVVSNHISWLDVPVLQTIYATCFIGKAEMQKWPFIGAMVKVGGTIFINRKDKRQLIRVNQIVTNKLQEGASIGLFPEGRTGPGHTVLQFKAPILEAAIMAKSKITPIVIEYCDHEYNRTSQVTYAGAISLYQSIQNTLLLKRIHVKIHSLPQINAGEFGNREDLSTHLYSQISKKYIEAGTSTSNPTI
jgi:1-acyl-sn-glycerol-3-phosphate acyltransferase